MTLAYSTVLASQRRGSAMMFGDVPALLRLDEEYDDVQLLVAVTMVF
jgi:hypothetical protein